MLKMMMLLLLDVEFMVYMW